MERSGHDEEEFRLPEEDVAEPGTRIRKAVTIDRPRGELYAFWRDLSNLSRFLSNVKSVEPQDEGWSLWRVAAPAGRTAEWEAVIHQDEPGSLIAWRSRNDADVDNAGSIRFQDAPAGRGTIVTVEFNYDPPAGRLGSRAPKIFGKEPHHQLAQDLRRFKALMETGEIPTSGDLREAELLAGGPVRRNR